MKIHHRLALSIALGLFAAGCAQEAEKAAEAAKQAESAAKDAANAAKSAAASAQSEAKDALKSAGDAAASAADAAKGAIDSLGGEFSTALTDATAKLKDVAGGSEALGKVTDIFTAAQSALAGATSSETAQAAMSKLGELEGKVDGAMESLKGLPAEAKTSIVALVEKGIAQLKTLADKVKGLPGVSDEIKTKLDAFVTKIESLKS
jgi:colicin import membrane protein